jgi:hypothetical protein
MEIPDELVEAKRVVEQGLLGLPGLVGIGLGMREVDGEVFDELAVRIYVEDAANVPPEIPEDIAGVGVCIIERQIEPCALPDVARYDDLMGGVRVAQPLRGSGTLGALVKDASTEGMLGLSCYHVVGGPGEDFVYQPTEPPQVPPISVADRIGSVVRAEFPQTPPLPFSPLRVSLIDAAVVSLGDATAATSVPPRTLSRAISDQGPGLPPMVSAVTGTSFIEPGVTRVRKRGFVTGVKRGLALSRNFTVRWIPGGPDTWLVDQVEILGDDIFCQPGDSGSLVLMEGSDTAVGLLWGLKPGEFVRPGHIGVMCEIGNVEQLLGASIAFV